MHDHHPLEHSHLLSSVQLEWVSHFLSCSSWHWWRRFLDLTQFCRSESGAWVESCRCTFPIFWLARSEGESCTAMTAVLGASEWLVGVCVLSGTRNKEWGLDLLHMSTMSNSNVFRQHIPWRQAVLLTIVIICEALHCHCNAGIQLCNSTVHSCLDANTSQVALMKILQSCMSRAASGARERSSEAAEVTLSSMLLIAVFEERVETWTCDRFSLGLLPQKDPLNDSPERVCVCVTRCYLLMTTL